MTTVDTVNRPGYVQVTMTAPVLDRSVVGELTAALEEAQRHPRVRAFVIASAGPAFCTGMPLTDGQLAADVLDGIAEAHALLQALQQSPLVTVALVEGRTTGGGIALAAACDQVIAGPDASFRITELLVGLLPAVLLPVVARRTGRHQAFSLALTARTLDAAAAVEVGLADRAATAADADLRSLMRELGRAVPAAVTALKRYRNAIEPGIGSIDLATTAMRERIEDPDSRARIALLAEQGLLP
ncbi:enoyl-CoA hydratase-related protein [Streptomyces sp. NPDC006654]|uniref:enoyl-CoA hydratase-related protein n=1 Tax=Streptomyces sp. NPDC006654 TaxID=3156897 RepID=UPI0033D46A1A